MDDDIDDVPVLEAIDIEIDSRPAAMVRFMQRTVHEVYDELVFIKMDIDALVAADLSLTKSQHNRLAKIHHKLGKILK